jgi:hypothetical protein
MQSIIVYIIFGLALVYAGWKIYKSVTHKQNAGCSKCEGSVGTTVAGAYKKD